MKDIKDPIVARVVNKIIERSNAGIKKYGTTLAENKTDCFLKHAQEEAMDFSNYAEKAIEERANLLFEIKRLKEIIKNQSKEIEKLKSLNIK